MKVQYGSAGGRHIRCQLLLPNLRLCLLVLISMAGCYQFCYNSHIQRVPPRIFGAYLSVCLPGVCVCLCMYERF